MNQSRIELNDDMMSAVMKMVEGNPGAISACMDLIKNSESIDPDNIMGGLGNLLLLDTFGIYGSDIYVLYSDICERNIGKMVTILRGCQLGFLETRVLIDACSRQDYSGKAMIDINTLYGKVKEQLSIFDPNNIVGVELPETK